jgi:hypothetical protein
MLLHQDGSTPEWVPGCQWDLMVTLDDATSELYAAFFVEGDGTRRSVRGLREVLEPPGLLSALSTDRGSHDGSTEAAGGTVDKSRRTQGHRALQPLGITLIPASSPEARGRSERVFRTLPDRLPKEWALAGIPAMAVANRSLAERVLPASNRCCAVPAAELGTAFVPWSGAGLPDVRCVQEARVVANDNPVRSQGLSRQIPQDTHRFPSGQVTVRAHEYPDGTLAVFHSPRCLARYHADGPLIETGHAHPGRRGPPHGSGNRPIVDPRPPVRETLSARG